MNYLIKSSNKNYSYLQKISEWTIAWAGTENLEIDKGRIVNFSAWPGHKPISMHWAGFHKLDEIPYRNLWTYYRYLKKNI
jgi:hypothetical protein